MRRRRFATLAAACGAACIIPDRDIQIDPGIDNLSAVRIVERAPQLPEMHELCNIEPPEDAELEYCPEVREERGDLPSGLIRPSIGNFCVCPTPGRTDRRAPPNFSIYAEDGDRDIDRPKDTLYGVLLLDPEQFTDEPDNAAAYDRYWEKGRSGELISVSADEVDNRTAAPIGRRVLNLWRFPIGMTTVTSPQVDLCNDNQGVAVAPGLHNLRFMVTDRPFFRAQAEIDTEGEGSDTVYDATQFGVPDLAAGATYAVIDYVFECLDASDPEIRAHDDAERAKQAADPETYAPDLFCDCREPG